MCTDGCPLLTGMAQRTHFHVSSNKLLPTWGPFPEGDRDRHRDRHIIESKKKDCVCSHMQVTSGIISVAFHTYFSYRVSHWTWISPIKIDWLSIHGTQGILLSLPQCRLWFTKFGFFYAGAADWTQVLKREHLSSRALWAKVARSGVADQDGEWAPRANCLTRGLPRIEWIGEQVSMGLNSDKPFNHNVTECQHLGD